MKLRRAVDGDCQYFFTLRTDPVACRMSRRRAPTWDEHLTWWENTSDYRFVAEEEGAYVGTLRLSRDGVVSIIVDPLVRGVGYGTKMLQALDEYAKDLVDVMFAEVAEENTGSQKIFLKAGWRPILFEKRL